MSCTSTFEYKDDKSSKFWEVTQSGSTVTVRYGKTGTNGQRQEKVFDDAASASKHVAKLISEKSGKGYIEVGTAPSAGDKAADTSGVSVMNAIQTVTKTKAQKASTDKTAKPKNPAQDPEATPECLMALLDQNDATNRLLAKHPRSSGDLLEKLSHSSDPSTRKAIAGNPNTPPETLVRLGQQFPKEFLANPVLDLLLMVNPALMEEVPEALLVRLLKQADCPASLLTWAAGHSQAKVQLAVAMNVKAPVQTLEKLRASRHQSVREAVKASSHGDAIDPIEDPETAFEQAVKDRLNSLALRELHEAWSEGDIGLAQWASLPRTFRLAKATNRDTLHPDAVVCILKDTNWTIEAVRKALPNYEAWEAARVKVDVAHFMQPIAVFRDSTGFLRSPHRAQG